MSTRRADSYRFDHGAQYFTARDARFRSAVEDWRRAGLIDLWCPRLGVFERDGVRPDSGAQRRYVGVPGMSVICKTLAASLGDCRFGWRADAARRVDGQWRVVSDGGEELRADQLIVTLPPLQTDALLGDYAVSRATGGVLLQPCWAVMAAFAESPLPDWDAAFVNVGPLSWVASQASKPGRPSATAWVLHASPAWSSQHLEEQPERVGEMLLDALRSLPGAAWARPTYTAAHRWRYSIAAEPLEVGCISSEQENLTIAGDWCAGSRVEGAYLSGLSAASRVADSLT